MTLSEFVKLLAQTKNIEGQAWLEEWQKHIEDDWQLFKNKTIDQGLILGLAQGIAIIIRDRIASIGTQKLYDLTTSSGHQFLEEIHKKALQAGIELQLDLIDTPLSYTEAMITQGLIKVDQDGNIQLTAKGEELASRVSAEIGNKL